MVGRPDIESIIVPAERSQGYRQWIKDGSDILKKALPFGGEKADFAITLGSGLGEVVNHLSPTHRVKIPYGNIGLPIGQVEGHEKEIIGALMANGKKIIIINGRTHAYEIPKDGIQTQTWGKLDRMELATGYLAMLNQVGVDNMILTSAVGGINHPLHSDERKPFRKEDLPIIGLIASDLNLAYPSVHMGPYVGFADKRFVNLKDADEELMRKFKESMNKTGRPIVPDFYHLTSRSTPGFEDPGITYDALLKRGQAVGMTFGPEKEFLSGASEIKRFIGIAIVVNLLELLEPLSETIAADNIGNYHPQDLHLAALANHEEVQEYGKMAAGPLAKAFTHLIKTL